MRLLAIFVALLGIGTIGAKVLVMVRSPGASDEHLPPPNLPKAPSPLPQYSPETSTQLEPVQLDPDGYTVRIYLREKTSRTGTIRRWAFRTIGLSKEHQKEVR